MARVYSILILVNVGKALRPPPYELASANAIDGRNVSIAHTKIMLAVNRMGFIMVVLLGLQYLIGVVIGSNSAI